MPSGYTSESLGYLSKYVVHADGNTVGSDGAWTDYSLTDENARQNMINEFVELYEGAFYVDQAEFEQNVRTFFPDPVEAEFIMDEIRNNHTFVPGEY